MAEMFKRGRGRPKGTGKTSDRDTLREVARLVRADSTLRPTTAIRRVVENVSSSALRRLQMKWQKDKSLYLDEAMDMEIEKYDPARDDNAPKNALTRADPRDEEIWAKVSLGGWNPILGLSSGEWIMRRDFPQGFLPLGC
jgi:hypothetical protein